MVLELSKDKNWIENIRRVASPNCDERPLDTDINLIVIHGISLPPKQYGGSHIDQLFTNNLDPGEHPYFKEICGLTVSSHLFIDRRGVITQYVPFNLRAWHAGESEFNGKKVCNDFSIGIELEGCDDEPYEELQYETLAKVIRVLISNLPALQKDRIVGHSDISPGRKTDPGPAFDWNKLHGLIDNYK